MNIDWDEEPKGLELVFWIVVLGTPMMMSILLLVPEPWMFRLETALLGG